MSETKWRTHRLELDDQTLREWEGTVLAADAEGIVLPVYLVPALTVALALGLAVESLATFGAGVAGRQPVFWRPAAMPLTVSSSRRSSELASSGASSARSADSARS